MTTNVEERTPVTPLTLHGYPGVIMLGFPPKSESMTHNPPASAAVKPVPEIVTVVPGSDAMGGEPLVGFATIFGATKKLPALSAEGSP
jgi:hypothetical protein